LYEPFYLKDFMIKKPIWFLLCSTYQVGRIRIPKESCNNLNNYKKKSAQTLQCPTLN
jgi:hypothetical protein